MNESRPRKSVPRALRELVFARAGGICQRCRTTPITPESFHVSQLRAQANGGPLVEQNLEAWCQPCNFAQRADDVRDTRARPRAWQIEALEPVVGQIVSTGAATVSAAPGAGKTIFAGLVFEALREADIVDRLIIVAPRQTIVDQWVDSLRGAVHLELKPFTAVERPGQDGVVTTYQSLTEDSLAVHNLTTQRRTLLVLDEVHHLGEPSRTAWARKIQDLAGSVDPLALKVAGVLNLSGTLWRSKRSERISTVRYEPSEDGKIVSVVDFNVGPELLIRQGQLRPVDLYRLDAKVSVQDWTKLDVVETTMADLDDEIGGAALRAIADYLPYRTAFVSSVLDRLEEIHRSLGQYHAKALIVAGNQKDARAYRDEVDAQMRARKLTPIAELAISDEPEAKKVLERFRKSNRVGVLCTVDMAGEGYDCPDIAVIGYATNKRTPMYVRQVVARAMRVTDRERELGIVPAKVVVPDVKELVQRFVELLMPILGEIVVPPDRAPDSLDGDAEADSDGGIWGPKYVVTDVEPVDERVSVALSPDEVYDFAGSLVAGLARELEATNVQPALAPRILAAIRRFQEGHPFDDPGQIFGERRPDVAAPPTAPGVIRARPLSIEEQAKVGQDALHRMEGWWTLNGDPGLPVGAFAGQANDAGNIATRGRGRASLDQLERAIWFERSTIRAHCSRTGRAAPKWL
jgi:superfamily II DNA or RNA helicase